MAFVEFFQQGRQIDFLSQPGIEFGKADINFSPQCCQGIDLPEQFAPQLFLRRLRQGRRF